MKWKCVVVFEAQAGRETDIQTERLDRNTLGEGNRVIPTMDWQQKLCYIFESSCLLVISYVNVGLFVSSLWNQ